MGVPRWIQKGCLHQESSLLKGRSQVPEQIVLKVLWQHHDRQYVYQMVKNIRVIYGKKKMDGTTRDRSTPPIEGVPFKK
jgi:hypothetical protein